MHKITIPKEDYKVSDLPFYGKNPSGEEISVNSRYITLNGKPWLPVSGEFHYARYKREDWERELCKMKACGVDVIATYVFWIHHEEIKGEFDFSGQRDLRAFVELCGKNGLKVLLRIGPWCHGECRNGGFPDWIELQNEFKTRTDDPVYLDYVERFFNKLGEEVKELMWKNGGPVIGVQLENEYEPYAEPNRNKRHEHMSTLKRLALKAGFEVPIYTATVWGYAAVNELEELPVSGGYADAAWAGHTAELKENPNFLMNHSLNDPAIGCDLRKNLDSAGEYDVDVTLTPYFTAEMGGGMQVTALRRVLIGAKDTEAITVSKLGSGAVLVGYYMFHGGTNPDGKLTSMEETTATGMPHELPVKSYDFQGVIRENGDIHESYDYVRRRHLMLNEWGDKIATTTTLIPDDAAKDAADTRTLRYSVRHNAGSDDGFIFINNHLRHRTLAYHKDECFELVYEGGKVVTPALNVANGQTLILPYNLRMGDAKLISSNANPLCRIGERYFFFTNAVPVYNFEDKEAEIITLTEEQSLHAFKLGERVFVADKSCALYETDGKIFAEYYGQVTLTVYEKTGAPRTVVLPEVTEKGSCVVTEKGDNTYSIDITYPDTDAEPMLTLDYLGDRADVFDARCPDKLIADWFTFGMPFKISLNQYSRPNSLIFKVRPYDPNRYFDVPPKPGCKLNGAEISFRSRLLIDDLL